MQVRTYPKAVKTGWTFSLFPLSGSKRTSLCNGETFATKKQDGTQLEMGYPNAIRLELHSGSSLCNFNTVTIMQATSCKSTKPYPFGHLLILDEQRPGPKVGLSCSAKQQCLLPQMKDVCLCIHYHSYTFHADSKNEFHPSNQLAIHVRPSIALPHCGVLEGCYVQPEITHKTCNHSENTSLV